MDRAVRFVLYLGNPNNVSKRSPTTTCGQPKHTNPATEVLCLPVDVTDVKGVAAAFDKIVDQLGVPNVLINNHGALALDTMFDSDIESWWNVQVAVKNLDTLRRC